MAEHRAGFCKTPEPLALARAKIILPPFFMRTVLITSLFFAGLALTAAGLASLWLDVGYRGLTSPGHWLVAEIDYGDVRLGHARKTDASPTRSGQRFRHPWFGTLSCFFGTTPNHWRYVLLTVPLWTVVASSFAMPAVAFVRGPLRRRRRASRNQCLYCGYDLTANATGVCPECGTTTSQRGGNG